MRGRAVLASGIAAAVLAAIALGGGASPAAHDGAGRAEKTSAAERSAILAAAAMADAAPEALVPEICFAPETDPAIVAAEAQQRSALRTSLQAMGGARHQFQDANRWSSTATNGFVPTQGQPITLTWSVVPDGTAIGSFGGEPASPSNLVAFLNARYGNQAGWLPILQSVFDRWSELAGITYVYEPHDDGAAFPSSGGQLGVRGDVRLSGHTIDGNYGILAYDFYPNWGDMVLDTGDAWFNDLSNDWRRLRNVMAHEHGHGLGMPHVCPVNATKLMEPFASLAFDGPQPDDVLAANRGYGDPLEPNDTPATATPLGALGNGTTALDGLSLDDDSDVDVFAFTVGAGKTASITATPVGQTYLNGPQNNDGTCSAGTPYATLGIADLSVQLLAADGATAIATAASNPAGVAEALSGVALPASGTYYVKVYGGSASNAQMYDLSLTIADAAPPPDAIFSDGFEGATLSAWSGSATDAGDLAPSAAGAILGAQSLRATVDDGAVLYVRDDSPASESRYRARFYVDEGTYVSGTNGGKTTLFVGYSTTLGAMQKTFLLVDRWLDGQHQIRGKVRRDDGTWAMTAWQPLPNVAAPVEIDWQKSSAPGANDGHFSLWIGGTPLQTLSNLQNQLRFVDNVRLGVLTMAPGSSGTILFDGFVSKRSSYIGP